MSDRTVHARMGGPLPAELVRYDKAGKWYLEPANSKRLPMTLSTAAAWAVNSADFVYLDRPGGLQFGALVRLARAAQEARR